MPGSGKSVASNVACDMKIPVVVMGDVIREEARRLQLEPTDQNLGQVGNSLREKEGPFAIARRCLEKIETLEKAGSNPSVVVIEGIRSKDEVDLFREQSSDFRLIEVWVPDDIRMRRIAARGRADDCCGADTKEAMDKRDKREMGWGMGEAIKSADMRVENGGSLEELEGKVREVLREIEKTSDSILNAASQRKSLC